eukprot:GHVU01090843.1.p1 GENE.GHVU01090843.1~~GHVU01090843.1.p1  ORF type:complete len:350 (+),score=22.10 GHVU01090843.1:138-1187(+)
MTDPDNKRKFSSASGPSASGGAQSAGERRPGKRPAVSNQNSSSRPGHGRGALHNWAHRGDASSHGQSVVASGQLQQRSLGMPPRSSIASSAGSPFSSRGMQQGRTDGTGTSRQRQGEQGIEANRAEDKALKDKLLGLLTLRRIGEERNIMHIMGVETNQCTDVIQSGRVNQSDAQVSGGGTTEACGLSTTHIHQPAVKRQLSQMREQRVSLGPDSTPRLEGYLLVPSESVSTIATAVETRLMEILSLLVAEQGRRTKWAQATEAAATSGNVQQTSSPASVISRGQSTHATDKSVSTPDAVSGSRAQAMKGIVDLVDIETCVRLGRMPQTPPGDAVKLKRALEGCRRCTL